MLHPETSPVSIEKPITSSWDNAVIYQIYPRSFAEERDSQGELRGEGSLTGIIDRLDYLKSLEIDAIWLSPFYPSPMKDGGYDVIDHTAVDERYGNLDDFERLVSEAHERDIKVMVDFVINHTSDQHRWFKQSRSSRHNDKADWYIWRDAKPDGSPPNNWASVFSLSQLEKRQRGELELPPETPTPPVSAWTYDEVRGQYYLHSFAAEQPDLNWANPAVRQAQKDVMRFWLDRGVDGFRVDAINYIGKDLDFKDEQPNPSYREGVDNPYDQLQRRHSANYGDTLFQYVAEVTNVLEEPTYKDLDTHLVFEAYVPQDMIDRLNAISPKRASAFNFSRIDAAWEAHVQANLIDQYYQHLLPGETPNNVNGNHDKPRLVSRIGARAARAAAVLNAFLPGQMYIYNGEEAGLTNVYVPPEKRDDKLGLRDGARTPLQWSDERNAGFSEADSDKLWLPIGPGYEQQNIRRELSNIRSSLHLYKSLLHLKHASVVLQKGVYHPLAVDHPHAFAASRRYQDDQLTLLMNFSGTEVQTRVIGAEQVIGRVVLSTSLVSDKTNQRVDLDKGIALEPGEALILRRGS